MLKKVVPKLCLLSVFHFVLIFKHTHTAGNSNSCFPHTVSLKIGQEGIVQCTCHGAVALYWYIGNDTTAVKPFIYLDGSDKYGPGYLSGEYDINENGSLVITNVSAEHGGIYSVFGFIDGAPEPVNELFDVQVVDPNNHGDDEGKVTITPRFAPSVTTNKAVNDKGKNGPESVTKSDHSGGQEVYVAMGDLSSFQNSIEQMGRLCKATVALLAIIVAGIIVVCIRFYIAKCAKNSDSEHNKMNAELKRILVSCPGSCESGCNGNTTKPDT